MRGVSVDRFCISQFKKILTRSMKRKVPSFLGKKNNLAKVIKFLWEYFQNCTKILVT